MTALNTLWRGLGDVLQGGTRAGVDMETDTVLPTIPPVTSRDINLRLQSCVASHLPALRQLLIAHQRVEAPLKAPVTQTPVTSDQVTEPPAQKAQMSSEHRYKADTQPAAPRRTATHLPCVVPDGYGACDGGEGHCKDRTKEEVSTSKSSGSARPSAKGESFNCRPAKEFIPVIGYEVVDVDATIVLTGMLGGDDGPLKLNRSRVLSFSTPEFMDLVQEYTVGMATLLNTIAARGHGFMSASFKLQGLVNELTGLAGCVSAWHPKLLLDDHDGHSLVDWALLMEQLNLTDDQKTELLTRRKTYLCNMDDPESPLASSQKSPTGESPRKPDMAHWRQTRSIYHQTRRLIAFNNLALRQVLSLEQAALAFITSAPHYPDMLAIADAIAESDARGAHPLPGRGHRRQVSGPMAVMDGGGSPARGSSAGSASTESGMAFTFFHPVFPRHMMPQSAPVTPPTGSAGESPISFHHGDRAGARRVRRASVDMGRGLPGCTNTSGPGAEKAPATSSAGQSPLPSRRYSSPERLPAQVRLGRDAQGAEGETRTPTPFFSPSEGPAARRARRASFDMGRPLLASSWDCTSGAPFTPAQGPRTSPLRRAVANAAQATLQRVHRAHQQPSTHQLATNASVADTRASASPPSITPSPSRRQLGEARPVLARASAPAAVHLRQHMIGDGCPAPGCGPSPSEPVTLSYPLAAPLWGMSSGAPFAGGPTTHLCGTLSGQLPEVLVLHCRTQAMRQRPRSPPLGPLPQTPPAREGPTPQMLPHLAPGARQVHASPVRGVPVSPSLLGGIRNPFLLPPAKPAGHSLTFAGSHEPTPLTPRYMRGETTCGAFSGSASPTSPYETAGQPWGADALRGGSDGLRKPSPSAETCARGRYRRSTSDDIPSLALWPADLTPPKMHRILTKAAHIPADHP